MEVLIVVTNIGSYHKGCLRTGLWLSELTHFYQKAQSAGYDITVASPKGGATPIDPVSLRPLHLDRLSKASLSIDGFKAVLQQTHTLQEVSNRVFDCILLTGGPAIPQTSHRQ